MYNQWHLPTPLSQEGTIGNKLPLVASKMYKGTADIPAIPSLAKKDM